MQKLKVGIIGATGMVGQQFIKLLQDHPWFDVVCLAASERSAGKPYASSVNGRWKLDTPLPDYVKQINVLDATADFDKITAQVDVVFCALDMDKQAIRDLEERYAAAGVAVISNNSAHRWTADVPMLIPEVNADHAKLIDVQRKKRGWTTGLIAVKPNCSIQSYTIILTALQQFKPMAVQVTSLQAVSGAGQNLSTWPEMADNVMPFIGGEEEKSEQEPLQIWGDLGSDAVELATTPTISATCVRVPVSNGHMADVSVNFEAAVAKDQLINAVNNFASPIANLSLPSAPKKLIIYFTEDNRPQTKLDRDLEKGMGVSMGRLREQPADNPYQWRFISLAHNTVRGAAGGAILMAELLVAKEYIKPRII